MALTPLEKDSLFKISSPDHHRILFSPVQFIHQGSVHIYKNHIVSMPPEELTNEGATDLSGPDYENIGLSHVYVSNILLSKDE